MKGEKKRGPKPGSQPSILCPCGGKTLVIETRVDGADKEALRRRRECMLCGDRLTTYERVDGPAPAPEPADQLLAKIRNTVRIFLDEKGVRQ